MTHQTSAMTSMEDPAEGLGKVVRWVENSSDVVHDNVLRVLPVLDGKVLDINVTRTFRRDLGVDHIDSRHIVFVDRSRTSLRKAELT